MIKFFKKSIVFILIFLIITPFLGRFLLSDENRILDGFYYEKENSLDVLFFGSSHMYTGVNPNVIWKNTGITSYNLGQPEQQIWTTYSYIKEALKYQNPKAIFVDVYTVTYDTDGYMPIENNNINLDTMRMSKNKLEAINTSVKPSDRPYFIFDLLKYKSNWKNISKDNFTTNFTNDVHTNKGYWEWFEVYENSEPDGNLTDNVGRLPEKTELYLNKIIDLCKDNDIPLVFIKTPVVISNDQQERYNRVAEIAKENDIDFINFNSMYEELGIDFKSDFIDEGKHLNFMGAHKVSDYLSEYISNNFDIADKRGKDGYDDWEHSSNVWYAKEENYYLSQEKDINKYKEKLDKDYYIVGIAYKGDDKNYAIIVNTREVVKETSGNYTFSLSDNIGDTKVDISFTGGKPSIKFNDNENVNDDGNLSIVVYDKRLLKVVDSKSYNI